MSIKTRKLCPQGHETFVNLCEDISGGLYKIPNKVGNKFVTGYSHDLDENPELNPELDSYY